MRRKIIISSAIIAVFTGCRSAAPVESSVPAPQKTPPIPTVEQKPTLSNRSWLLHPVTQSQRYQVLSTTSLELEGLRDSTVSKIALTLNSQPGDTALIFSGTIDSLFIQRGVRIGTEVGLPALPVAFSGSSGKTSIAFTTPAVCDRTHIPVETLIRQILPDVPKQPITAGSSWTDTTLFSTCRGNIPLTTTVIGNYRVVGARPVDSQDAILIEVTQKAASVGEGAEEQHQVKISSLTTSSVQLWIDAVSGAVVRSEGQSTGTVTLGSSGTTQVFAQLTRTVITARRQPII